MSPSDGEAFRATAARQTRARALLPEMAAITWQVIFAPARFYLALPIRGGLSSPSGYVLTLMAIVSGVSYLLEEVVLAVWDGTRMGEMVGAFLPESRLTRLIWVAATPLLSWFGTFAAAAVARLVLHLWSEPRPRYEAVFRVFAYAHAPMVFVIVPLCGTLCGTAVATVYVLVLEVLGLTMALGVPGWRAALAVLATVVCSTVPVAVIVLALALIG